MIAETQREILLRLTAIAQLDPKRWYPSDNDALCRFCGLKPRRGNLCESCEERRSRLAERFPDVPPPLRQASAPTRPRGRELTRIGDIKTTADLFPRNSEDEL